MMILGLCACGEGGSNSGSDKTSGLQVGFGREKIMPKEVTKAHLAGSDAANRVATGYLDYLYVTCVAIKEADETVLVYTMDVITTAEVFSTSAKAAISQATGVPQENIILNSTHTHSGVSMEYNWNGVDEYKTLFNQAASKAGQDAIADLSAAEVYVGSTETEGMTFVRLYKLSNGSYLGSNYGDSNAGTIEGHAYEADTELQVVKFARAAEDKKDIVLMSFPSHATMNSINNRMTISADFPSPARDYVEANSDSLVAYFIAAAGDQAPNSEIAGEAYSQDYKVYGEKLGQYVVDLLQELTKAQGSGITLKTQTYTGKTIKEGLEKLEEAKKVAVAASAYGNTNAATTALVGQYGFDSVYEAKAIVARSIMGDTNSMVLKTLAIGDLSFIFAPYEMFSEQGIYIKENSPYENTIVITCGEGDEGYLPSAMGFEMRCYEAHITEFARGTAEDLAKTFVDMLTQMKNGA